MCIWRWPVDIIYLPDGGEGGINLLAAVVQSVNKVRPEQRSFTGEISLTEVQCLVSFLRSDDTVFAGDLSLLGFMRHHFRVLEKPLGECRLFVEKQETVADRIINFDFRSWR